MFALIILSSVALHFSDTATVDTTRSQPRWILETDHPEDDEPFSALLHIPASTSDTAIVAHLRVRAPGKGLFWLRPVDKECSKVRDVATEFNPELTTSWLAAQDTTLSVCIRIVGERKTSLVAELWQTRRDTVLGPADILLSGSLDVGASKPLSPGWSLLLSAIGGAIAAAIGGLAQHFLSINKEKKDSERRRLETVAESVNRVLNEVDAQFIILHGQLRSLNDKKEPVKEALSEAGHDTLEDTEMAPYFTRVRGAGYVTTAKARYDSIARVNEAFNAFQKAQREGKPAEEISKLKQHLLDTMETAEKILAKPTKGGKS
jgi:hypothetical protein